MALKNVCQRKTFIVYFNFVIKFLVLIKFMRWQSKPITCTVTDRNKAHTQRCNQNLQCKATKIFYAIQVWRKERKKAIGERRKVYWLKCASLHLGNTKKDLVRRMLTFRCFYICSSPFLLRSFFWMNWEIIKLLWQNDCPIGVAIYNIKFWIDK